MSEVRPGVPSGRMVTRRAGPLQAARWLSLAATPTFAFMALLTAASRTEAFDSLCSSGHVPGLGGMIPMYLLMSAFHATPWLNLVSGRLSSWRCC